MRVIFWFCLMVAALGSGLSAWLVVDSLFTGKREVLMVLGYIHMPTLLASLGTLTIVSSESGLSLRRRERQAGWIAGSLTLLTVCVMLIALG